MKKLFSICLCLLLVSCGNKTQETSIKEAPVYHIASPSGAPALAFYNEIENNFETMEAGAIKTLVVSGDLDVAVLPTNVAVALINGGANYQLAASITFGNFYVVSTGRDDNDVMEAQDDIVLFQEGGVPDKVFHYVYEQEICDSVRYVNEASDALREIVNGESTAEYVLIAEPAMYVALNKNENAKEYANLQELYSQKSGLTMFQASILVRNDLNQEEVNLFLSKIEKDIQDLLQNPDLLQEKIEQVGLSEEEATAYFSNVKASIAVLKNGNRVSLGYQKASDHKMDIDAFLTVLGMKETSEEIYYR